jgi:hypothetical protein
MIFIKQEYQITHMTREPAVSFKLYNRELSSTIDTKQNGKKSYIYSELAPNARDVIMSCIQGFALMNFSVRMHMQMLFILPMHSSVRRDLYQTGLTTCFCNSSLSGLLFMEGDDVSCTFLVFINFSIRIGVGIRQTRHMSL